MIIILLVLLIAIASYREVQILIDRGSWNLDKTNNRIDNLQLLNNRANCSKGKTRRQLLPTGVHKRNNKYVAIIMIGAYDNPQEASINYQRVVAHLDDLSLKSGS